MDVIALVLCFAAWWIAWEQTRDLTWPCENDQIRDMGAAQSMLDGQGGADPAYLNVRWWYNPLVPAVVALSSRVLDMPLHEAYARLGAHLNLIAPLGFYAMMAVLFERRAALAGLVGFLFLGPIQRVSWLHATYSPWLWTCNFAQGLLYLAILVAVSAYRARSRALGLGAGVIFGLTLLAHTGPGVVLAGALLALALGSLCFWRRAACAAKWALATSSAIGVVAAVTASPFWLDVIGNLRRGVRNPAPMQWIAGELVWQNWQVLLGWHASLRGWVALAGLLYLSIRRRAHCRYSARAVFGWAAAVFLALGYGYAAQVFTLPPFLPSWHFYFYLHALESVLFGVGVSAFARALFRVAEGSVRCGRFSTPAIDRGVSAVVIGALLVVAAARYPRYRKRMDLVDNRRDALAFGKSPLVELYEWTLGHVDPRDVVLADMGTSFHAIMAAGRKVVALHDLFSNPYVDVATRARDAGAMLDQIRGARFAEFLYGATVYQVRYLAFPAKERTGIDAHGEAPLHRVFSTSNAAEGFDVYEVRADGMRPGASTAPD
jgi:hypothetical protein